MKSPTEDHNIYRRLPDGSFEPFGIYTTNTDWFCDGLWRIKHHDYSKSITSAKYQKDMMKVKGLPSPTWNEVLDIWEYIDYITENKEFVDWYWEEPHTLVEVVSKIIRILNEKNKQESK